MKKIKNSLFILMLLAGGLSYQSFTDPGGGPVGDCECTVSSNSSENVGKCKARVSGGDACISANCNWLSPCNCNGDTCSSES